MNTNTQPMAVEDYPGIFTLNTPNPTVNSYGADEPLTFGQTKETLEDLDLYVRFLKTSIYRFRNSKTYKHYKGFLMNQLGINCCQYHGLVRNDNDDEMATIELHHHILTLFDEATIITEHIINSGGIITTFDLVKLLEEEHTQFRIPSVMLCKTCHQLQHNDPSFFIRLDQVFGKWTEFLTRYPKGISKEIYYKLYGQIKREVQNRDASDARVKDLLQVAEVMYDWSEKNNELFGEPQVDISAF